MRSAYKIVVFELQQKSKEDKKTLSAMIWFHKRKLQKTVHFVTVDTSVFFFPPCCTLVESADFLQSYLLSKVKICWDVTSYWMANGYRRFEDRSFFIFQGQAVSRGTAWPCKWRYRKRRYVFSIENPVTAETTGMWVPKISHCLLFVKMPSCCCLVRTVSGSFSSDCQCMRGKMGKMGKMGKGKVVPLQAWSGPEGSRKLRFPDFITTAQDGGKVVSLTHRPPLPPGNAPGTHFC